MEPSKVCVIGGAGYVGLVTGAGLAEIGHNVTNVDVDQERIRLLQSGVSPIYEEGLQELVERGVKSGRLGFSDDLGIGIRENDIVIIAVGTPSGNDGQADLSQIISVAETLAVNLNSFKVIVIKSTVPVGTIEMVQTVLNQRHQDGKDFEVVSNPEFLREGKAVFDFFYPDRIVIGTESVSACQTLRSLYQPLIDGSASFDAIERPKNAVIPIPTVETDVASAQMIKYASNAFLATRVSFINEIAGLVERVGADVNEVVRGLGFDPRIGDTYMQAGIGFGGPCLEKDLRALIRISETNGYNPELLSAVLQRNEKQVEEVMAKLKRAIGGIIYQKIVAIYGLSFKAGTNDVRNSGSLRILDRLEESGALIRAHDPVAIAEARSLRPDISYHENPYDAVAGAHALIILTEWPEFAELDYGQILGKMKNPSIIDGRNLLNGDELRKLGFTYTGMGRA
jgi:UDPglucose 6-dehydrogenase